LGLVEEKMNRFNLGILSFALIIFVSSFVYATEDPNAIVAKADLVRCPAGSYRFVTEITAFEGEQKKSENGYKGYIKDLDHTLIAFTSPASEKGKSLLMLGEDLWIYLPNLKKPVRISFQQRLVGDVSNGDMARSNFAHDYNATLAGEEKINDIDTYVLDLVAKSPDKTYNKIKYWVAKNDYSPVQAEFFTVSGRSLKTCTYEDLRIMAGVKRPSKYVYQDSFNKNKKSILVFKEMTPAKLEDKMFTKDYLKTLE
jgi:outer membrane lipoprotein-sorting protein